MISTSKMLINELEKYDSEFLTIVLDEKEYVIDSIVHLKEYYDSPSTHLALKARSGGDGNIKR